jgi:flagellar biosynthesis protein FlhF
MEVDMKIKRYTATSMRAALAQVRAEQGPDAVILSSRRGEDGIEVIAAIDYDEALFVEMNRQRNTAPAIDPPAVEPASVLAEATQRATTSGRAQTTASATPTAPARPAADERSTSPAPRAPASAPASTRARAIAAAPVRAPAAAAARAPAPTSLPARDGAAAHATASSSSSTAGASSLRKPLPPAVRSDLGYGAMHRELQDLRQMLETGLAGMTWNDKRLREPLKARVLEELSALDIAPDVAMALAARAPRRTSLENPSHIPLALLVKHLPVVDDLGGLTGGIIAVVGPTGAGKTTTIAKLAARWCMQHGSQDLALVSTDSYRIGARDQLMTYARILGAPMHAANSGRDLARVLDRLKSKKLILIDTAGMGPRDVRLTEQLSALQLGAARARVLLALPAQGEGHALEEIVQAFAPLTPVACILTKVDEAASLGAVISTTLRHRLKIAYVCDGQRVPEDLHAAHQKRVWLVRAALKLKEDRPPVRDEAYYVRNFGRAHAHA